MLWRQPAPPPSPSLQPGRLGNTLLPVRYEAPQKAGGAERRMDYAVAAVLAARRRSSCTGAGGTLPAWAAACTAARALGGECSVVAQRRRGRRGRGRAMSAGKLKSGSVTIRLQSAGSTCPATTVQQRARARRTNTERTALPSAAAGRRERDMPRSEAHARRLHALRIRRKVRSQMSRWSGQLITKPCRRDGQAGRQPPPVI